MKRLLSIDEQIEHMKNKGISFNVVSEAEAKKFLMNNNYFLKLYSYRKNYQKYDIGVNAGKYINLDFGYLKELSTIDMHLRYLIFEMCLDIEHAIKVKLLNKVLRVEKEDGYELIKAFLSQGKNIRCLENIKAHRNGAYCKDLINKYYPYFPIWVFVEVISFGNLLSLCAFCKDTYGIEIANSKLMNEVRDIRNACAHSNCLINNMIDKIDSTKQPNNEITNFVKEIKGISNNARGKYLNRRFSYSLVTLMYVYNELVQDTPKRFRFAQFKNFMEERVVRNKEYFVKNDQIVGIYKFHKKIVDNLQL